MEQLERGVAIQFLNREPFEPPVFKYGKVGKRVASSFYIGKDWNYQFLNMELLERLVANSF